MAKITPYPPCTGTVIWLACRRVPGQLPDAASGNTTSPYCRAVRVALPPVFINSSNELKAVTLVFWLAENK